MDPKNYKALLAETAKRFATTKAFDVKDYTFTKQWEFITSKSRYNVVKCSRRAGKTEALLFKHYIILKKYAGVNTLYVGLNRKTSKNIFWERFKKFLNDRGEEFEANNTELTIRLSNGSMFYIMGCATEKDVDKARGMAFKYISLDEIQSFPPFVRRLIREVFRPTLKDWKGGMDLTGTPNPSCAGVFKDAWDNNSKSGMGGYEPMEWTLHDNEFLYRTHPNGVKGYDSAEEVIEEELRLTGLTVDDPVIQRELFGRWVKDNDSSVYKYCPAINDYTGQLPINHDWRYIMGLDLGFNDADAIVILAFCDDFPEAYIVEEFKLSNQDITSLAQKVQSLENKYGRDKFVSKVADIGGLGKKIIEELSARFGIHFEAAEKQNKWGYIKLMNDNFRSGKIKVLKENCESLIYEWENLNKVQAYRNNDPLKEVEDGRVDNHLADAALYAWREAYNYNFKEKVIPPKPGSKEFFNQESERYLNEAIDQVRRDTDNSDDDWGNW